jgi:hypothetical protein
MNRYLLFLTFTFIFSFVLFAAPSIPKKDDPTFTDRQQLIGRLGLRTIFWVCSEKSKVQKLDCEDMGSHETEGPKADLIIEFSKNRARHAYGLRHAIPMTECRILARRIRTKFITENSFCIRGGLAELSAIEIGWVFYEFRAGTDSVCENDDCVP